MQTIPSPAVAKAITAAAMIPLLLATACKTVGPDYQRPEVSVPQTFRFAPGAEGGASIADQPWQEVFVDPALQALIVDALANNYDLQVAVARIEQARALVGVAKSQGQPQLDYNVHAGGENTFVPGVNGAGTASFASVGGLLNAAWEFDVWGRIRRATEAAEANLLGQEDIHRGVILTLVSDLATDYYRLIELDRELAIADESSRVFRDTLDLFTLRFEAGRDSRLPVERTRALYDASVAKAADVRREIALQENAISILTGAHPHAIVRGHALSDQAMPATPLGETTALLQRRPDILNAEQTMIRANAEVGVAIADKYPKIGLSSLIGLIGASLGGWEGFGVWNLAGGAAGPIYTGGRLESIINERKAFWDETIAQYRKTVLVAFRETADALAAQQTLAARRASLEAQVADLRAAAELAMIRYKAGRASYFEVLEAQQQLFPAEDALAQVQRDQLLATVSLYKALGGGWSGQPVAPAAVTATSATTTPG